MAPDRERSHLVIGLGEGTEGQRAREALNRAADRAGKPVSTWARESLLGAAVEAHEDPLVELELLTIGAPVKIIIDLRSIVAMRAEPDSLSAKSRKMEAVSAITKLESYDNWPTLFCPDASALIDRWKRVRRAC